MSRQLVGFVERCLKVKMMVTERFRDGDSSRVAATIRESHDDVGSSSLQLSAVPCCGDDREREKRHVSVTVKYPMYIYGRA